MAFLASAIFFEVFFAGVFFTTALLDFAAIALIWFELCTIRRIDRCQPWMGRSHAMPTAVDHHILTVSYYANTASNHLQPARSLGGLLRFHNRATHPPPPPPHAGLN